MKKIKYKANLMKNKIKIKASTDLTHFHFKKYNLKIPNQNNYKALKKLMYKRKKLMWDR